MSVTKVITVELDNVIRRFLYFCRAHCLKMGYLRTVRKAGTRVPAFLTSYKGSLSNPVDGWKIRCLLGSVFLFFSRLHHHDALN